MKKISKSLLILFSFLSFAIILASCEPFFNSDQVDDDDNKEVEEVFNEANYSDVKGLNRVDVDTSRKKKPDQHFIDIYNEFAYKMFDLFKVDDDFCISPLSVFFAICILYEVGDDIVKEEVKEVLGTTDDDMALAGAFFKSLIVYRYDNVGTQYETLESALMLTNSIWLNTGATPVDSGLESVAEKLYTYVYEAPFSTNNEVANAALREFIRIQTKGLIDEDFDLSPSTLFALVNTLYLKDLWLTPELVTSEAKFNNFEKETVITYLNNYYFYGNIIKTDEYSACYTNSNYYALKFLKYNKKESVITGKDLALVNGKNAFEPTDDKIYFTRCIFPKFVVDSEYDLADTFASKGYFQYTFTGFQPNIIEEEALVSRIIHRALLNVNEKGIEGAAVTIIEGKAGSAGPQEIVYQDFVVDNPFVFMLTNGWGVVVFIGQVNNPQSK